MDPFYLAYLNKSNENECFRIKNWLYNYLKEIAQNQKQNY